MTTPSRRQFIKASAAAAATAGVAQTALAGNRAPAANDKIRIGFIGPGGRGFSAHVKSLVKLSLIHI